MSTASVRSVRGGRSAETTDRPSTAIVAAIGLAILLLVGFLVAWLGGWIRFTTDPRVTEILGLQEQAMQRFGQNGGPTNVVEATAMVGSMMEIRQRVEALPENLRSQVEQSGGRMFQSAFRARIDNYFAAPPEQRRAELDRQINQEEVMRKAFEAGRALMTAVGGGQAGGTSQASTGTTTGGQASAPASGRPAGPGNPSWNSRSEDDRNRWRKSMVDRTTPDERARYTEWRRAMEERRVERGLPAGGGPR